MFQPVIPLGGFAGWRFLERTQGTQMAAFTESPSIERGTAYFREKIGQISSAKELVEDRQLLEVALGAFGLEGDIDNKFFIKKIMEDGTTASDALSNRLADKSYATFSKAFGFGDPLGPRNTLTSFADQIIEKYETKKFETAVGEQNPDLRLALSLENSILDVTSQTSNKNAQWFAVMGSPPLRKIFETALGLPTSFASIDIDQQLTTFQDRSNAIFGTDRVSDFSNEEKQSDLLRMFLVRSQANQTAGLSSGNIALTLLGS